MSYAAALAVLALLVTNAAVDARAGPRRQLKLFDGDIPPHETISMIPGNTPINPSRLPVCVRSLRSERPQLHTLDR